MYDKFVYSAKSKLSSCDYLPVHDAQGTQTGVTDVAPIESEFAVVEIDVTSVEKKNLFNKRTKQ